MMRSTLRGWPSALAALCLLCGGARAESALDVSPICTTAMQSTTKDVLLSRGAFCQKSEPLEYTIVDENNAERGRVEIDAYAYSDNPLNRLEWPLKFRFRTRLVSGSAAGLQIKPTIQCGEACTVAPNAGVPLAIGGLSNEVVVMVTPNMKAETKLEFQIYVDYRVAKSGDDFDGGPSAVPFYGKAYVPSVRCDVGLAKAGTRGCVYNEAPAILRSVKTNDPDVDESALHIREAQAAGKPGKFVPRGDGTIFSRSDTTPLSRLRDKSARNKNRAASLAQCVVQFGKTTGQCTFTGDPDDRPSKCDCDEYPFAATQEGAASGEFSVKKIDMGDNRRAGARLGCFMAAQRVLDGESFYIDVDPLSEASSEDACDAGYSAPTSNSR
jgi:hypothetical protein